MWIIVLVSEKRFSSSIAFWSPMCLTTASTAKSSFAGHGGGRFHRKISPDSRMVKCHSTFCIVQQGVWNVACPTCRPSCFSFLCYSFCIERILNNFQCSFQRRGYETFFAYIISLERRGYETFFAYIISLERRGYETYFVHIISLKRRGCETYFVYIISPGRREYETSRI